MVADARTILKKGVHDLPEGWAWEWFTDVMDVDGGTQPPASEFVDEPRPGYVRLVQIRDFESDSHATYIPDSPRWRKCRTSDVLIGRYGAALGRICTGLEGAYNVALAKVVPSDRVYLRFAYHLLKSNYFQDPLLASGGRSAQAGFNKDGLSVIPLPIPPIPEQRAIAYILGTLDHKIELNRRMNETLEEIARTLFKSRFVDTVESEIPKGWCEGKIEKLATLSREAINPSEFPNETFDHYSIPAFDEGRLPRAELGGQIQSNKFIVPANAVLLSKLNPRIPRVWLPSISKSQRSICSTEFLVATPQPGISREYLYGLFSSQSFLEVFSTLVTGTSGSHQRVKPEYLIAIDVLTPPKELIVRFTEMVVPMYQRTAQNIEESRTLSTMRDTLLPKLISGELRMKDAERTVGDCV